jgi:hypothetical protein
VEDLVSISSHLALGHRVGLEFVLAPGGTTAQVRCDSCRFAADFCLGKKGDVAHADEMVSAATDYVVNHALESCDGWQSSGG